MAENLEPERALNLDAVQQQSFVDFYNSLPPKPATTVRFFARLDYFTVHGSEDTSVVAGQAFCTNAVRYMGAEPKLSYLVIGRNCFEKSIRELLLVKQYRVEVYTKPSQSKSDDWTLRYKGSPGNLAQFEEMLFENAEIVFNSTVMAIKIVNDKKLAVACVNSTEFRMQVCEFIDNELYTELLTLLTQVSPKECIVPQGESVDTVSLCKILQRNGILTSRMRKADFNADNIEQDLNRLLHFLPDEQRNAMAKPETKLSEAMGCLQAILRYANLAGDDKNFDQFKIGTFDRSRFVRLDGATIAALDLLPKDGVGVHGKSNKYSSVFGMLNRCATPQGRRLLERWIRQPLRDFDALNERLAITDTLTKESEVRNLLSSNCLSRMPDLLILSKKLASKKATLHDLYRIYQAIDGVTCTIKVSKRITDECVKSLLVDPLNALAEDVDKFRCMVEQVLDFDSIDVGEFLMKHTFDRELEEIHEKKQAIRERMDEVFRRAAHELQLECGKSIKFQCNNQHGYFFRVTSKEERVLRKNKNFEILDALKGAVRFTNKKLRNLNDTYKELRDSYEQQQKHVTEEIFDVAAGYADTVRNINLKIAEIDVFTSFANAAANASVPFVKPILHKEGSGMLRLKKLRHPCIELRTANFVANDVDFMKDEKTMYVVTGPNMGGKSTYIRSVGVCVLMAHIGSLVPCSEAHISIVDGILARVGADDCLLKGLSTFMTEMVETAAIIKNASENSLVVIDELGRGTSTYDGCGIAWAVAEHLATRVKCFAIFTTHFHEITRLEEQCATVRNLHVTAVTTDTTISPLYQLKRGACDKSYGIHCCRMCDFPESVVQEAVRLQHELENVRGTQSFEDYESSIKRTIIEEGDGLIEQCLEECEQLDLDKSSEDELKETVERMKSQLRSRHNLLVESLLGE